LRQEDRIESCRDRKTGSAKKTGTTESYRDRKTGSAKKTGTAESR
jgi:hypothetical protein